MGLSKLATECEKCAYVHWCPNKRMAAMAVLPLPSVDVRDLAIGAIETAAEARFNVEQIGFARQRPDTLERVVDNLRDQIAKAYGVPRCFFDDLRK